MSGKGLLIANGVLHSGAEGITGLQLYRETLAPHHARRPDAAYHVALRVKEEVGGEPQRAFKEPRSLQREL